MNSGLPVSIAAIPDFWIRTEDFAGMAVCTLGEAYAGTEVGSLAVLPQHLDFAHAWLTAMAFRLDDRLSDLIDF